MSKIDECKSEGRIAKIWMEDALSKGQGASPSVLRRLAGMIARGDTWDEPEAPPAPPPRAVAAPVVQPEVKAAPATESEHEDDLEDE